MAGDTESDPFEKRGPEITGPIAAPGSSTVEEGNGFPQVIDHRHSVRSLIDRLVGLKVWILAVALVCMGLTALYFIRNPVAHSSTIVVFMDGEPSTLAEETPGMPARSLGITRISHMATSTEMLDHLIQHFDLYTHFAIDTTAPHYYEQACDYLIQSIALRSMDQLSLGITVSDADASLATDMANEMFFKLRRMLDAHALDYLERTTALYEQVIDHTQVRSAEQEAHLKTLVTESAHMIGDKPLPPGHDRDPAIEMGFQLASIAAQLSSNYEGMLQAQNKFEITTAMQKQKALPGMQLMRKATVDIKTSPAVVIAKTMMLTLMSTVGLMILAISVWHRHGPEFLEYINT